MWRLRGPWSGGGPRVGQCRPRCRIATGACEGGSRGPTRSPCAPTGCRTQRWSLQQNGKENVVQKPNVSPKYFVLGLNMH